MRGHVIYRGVIWGDISRSINGGNVLGGVAYKNKYIYTGHFTPRCACAARNDRSNLWAFDEPEEKSPHQIS